MWFDHWFAQHHSQHGSGFAYGSWWPVCSWDWTPLDGFRRLSPRGGMEWPTRLATMSFHWTQWIDLWGRRLPMGLHRTSAVSEITKVGPRSFGLRWPTQCVDHRWDCQTTRGDYESVSLHWGFHGLSTCWWRSCRTRSSCVAEQRFLWAERWWSSLHDLRWRNCEFWSKGT